MTFKYINDYYGLSVKRGSKIKFQGTPCTVVSAPCHYLNVVKDDTGNRLNNLHPTWEIEYLDQQP